MANEITLAYQSKEEERYWENEMVPIPTLSSFISFSSVSQLSMMSKPNKI
jgi:hypothetical protein